MSDKVTASHILLKNEIAYNVVKQLIDQLPFETLALTFSHCPSGEKSGLLGEFGKGRMVKPFEDAVFALNVGEISQEPVVTQFGVHIIRRDK